MIDSKHEQLITMAHKAGEISKKKKEERIFKYSKNPKICKNCGKVLNYEQRNNTYCSSHCAAQFRYKDRKTVCKNCGKPIKKGSKSPFCSRNCWKEYNQKKYIEEWKSGKVSGNMGEGIHDRVRSYMLEKVNFKCERCGWNTPNPYDGKVRLEIHHKDGNYLNSKEDNLEVLCPNCHSLTENYGARNMGKGRKIRRSKAKKKG